MKHCLAALSEDRILSRKDKEQIIVTTVCSVSGAVLAWSLAAGPELNLITVPTWTRSYKTAWGLSRGTDGSLFILDQSAGGRGCPSATKMWAREILDMYEQCLSLPTLPDKISQITIPAAAMRLACLNQLLVLSLLQISETTETVLEPFCYA